MTTNTLKSYEVCWKCIELSSCMRNRYLLSVEIFTVFFEWSFNRDYSALMEKDMMFNVQNTNEIDQKDKLSSQSFQRANSLPAPCGIKTENLISVQNRGSIGINDLWRKLVLKTFVSYE